MARFIELHDTNGQQVLINPDWIIEVKSDDRGGSYVYFGCVAGSSNNGDLRLNRESRRFMESYLTVKNMLGIDY